LTPRIARTFTPDRRAHAVYRTAAERQQGLMAALFSGKYL
jgi:hypothetical protein